MNQTSGKCLDTIDLFIDSGAGPSVPGAVACDTKTLVLLGTRLYPSDCCYIP